MKVTAFQIVNMLRHLQNGNDSNLVVIRMRINDPRFDWRSLPQRTACNLPGIDVGQDTDLRFNTDGHDGLHVHVFRTRGVVELHLDEVNGCHDVAAHGVADTQLAAGTGIGVGLGLLIGALLGRPGLGAALGGIGGAIAGSQIPKRTPQIYLFEDLLREWDSLRFRWARA